MSNLPADRFTAYKVSTEGNQMRWGYIHGLTKAKIDKLPFGVQHDDIGSYTWSYGINNGRKV